MKAIPNQPFIFELMTDGASPFMSEIRRVVDDPGKPVVIFDTDTIYCQFEREVTATPVMPDLIDQILAINLVTDPGFDDPAQWSIIPGGWTVTGGKAIHTGAGPDNILMALPIVSATLYMVEYTISGIGGGATITPYLGSINPGNAGTTQSTNGTFKETIQNTFGSPGALQFEAAGGDVTIDNVKLYKVIDGDPGTPINGWDWNVNDWDYQEDGIEHYTGNTSALHFDGLTSGKHYRMHLTFEASEFGYFSIYEDANFVEVANEAKEYYYFKATGTEVTLSPSDEFAGKITSVYFQEIDSFDPYFDAYYALFYRSDTDGVNFDVTQFVKYHEDRATLVLTPNDIDVVIQIAKGCGNLEFVTFDGETETIYTSNKFKRQEGDETHSLMVGYSDCRAWGFDFEDFRLQHRVELDFTNPEYPFTKVTQTKSDGTKDMVYAQRDKVYRVKTEHLDETAHSCISLIMACNYFLVDNRHYFWEDKNYAIDWSSNGENFTAPAVFKLTEKNSVVFNTNASCKSKGYNLIVLHGLEAYTSFKQLDKFNIGMGDTMVIRLENLEINGVDQIATPQYKVIRRDALGNYTPDLNIANGINGNWSDAFGASTFVQNVDEWINSFIFDEELRFYDAMSIVELLPGTTFKVNIALRYSAYSTSWVQRRYTNDGMALLAFSETPLLTYV